MCHTGSNTITTSHTSAVEFVPCVLWVGRARIKAILQHAVLQLPYGVNHTVKSVAEEREFPTMQAAATQDNTTSVVVLQSTS